MEKEILQLIGYETPEGEEASIEKIREHVNSKFVPVSEISNRSDIIEPLVTNAIGKRLGSLQTSLIKQAKDLGVEIKHSDFKDKQVEDILPVFFTDIKTRLEAKPKDDGALAEELKSIKSERDTFKNSLEEMQNTLQTKEQEFTKERSNWLVNQEQSKAWEGIKFGTAVKPYEIKGFKADISEKYDSKTDEDGKVYPVYKTGEKKGSRVQSPTNATKMMTWSELLSSEAKKADLLAKENEGKPGGKPDAKPPTPATKGYTTKELPRRF